MKYTKQIKPIYIGGYECSLCGKLFNSNVNKKRHENRVHLKIKKKCVYCQNSFKNLNNHKKHCNASRYLTNEEPSFFSFFYKYYPIIEYLYRSNRHAEEQVLCAFIEAKAIYARSICSKYSKNLSLLVDEEVKEKKDEDSKLSVIKNYSSKVFSFLQRETKPQLKKTVTICEMKREISYFDKLLLKFLETKGETNLINQ